MIFLKLDHKKVEFVFVVGEQEFTFPGTVDGAVELNNILAKYDENLEIQMSSDLNHPDDFPKFEPHSIDIAAGYIDGALAAGILEVY